ncbi:MAG: hypothetical protein LRY39_02160 [Alphaproteobacteria bacterium]|nr:hypothetical protein [Alphaproteobacteria bacterium]
MLVAQVLTAQHASVHFLEGADSGFQSVSLVADAEKHTNSAPHKKSEKPCDICLSAQNASQGIMGAPVYVVALSLTAAYLVPPAFSVTEQAVSRAYQARAPPSFLV